MEVMYLYPSSPNDRHRKLMNVMMMNQTFTVNPRRKVEKFIPISGRRKRPSTYMWTLNKYKIFGPNIQHDENGHTN